MASFLDRHGRKWLVEFDLWTLSRVKRDAEVDLLTLHDPDSAAMQILQGDHVRLLAVLLAVVEPQIKAAGLTEEEFARGLHEEHVWDAVAALLQGVTDYYPPAKRAALQPVIAATIEAARKVKDRSLHKLTQLVMATDMQKLSRQIEQAIENQLTSGKFTGPSPASPASTPDR
jgi:hypothetical protein